jgi:DNA-binding HxlR family transcriptional regulator
VAIAREVIEPTPSWDPYARGCPSRDVLDQIGSKWAVLVLGELGRHGACRFTQLRRQLEG